MVATGEEMEKGKKIFKLREKSRNFTSCQEKFISLE